MQQSFQDDREIHEPKQREAIEIERDTSTHVCISRIRYQDAALDYHANQPVFVLSSGFLVPDEFRTQSEQDVA